MTFPDIRKPRAPRSLAAILVFAMVLPSAATWCWFVQFAGHPFVKMVYVASKLVQFLLPIAWMVGVERRRLGDLFGRKVRGIEEDGQETVRPSPLTPPEGRRTPPPAQTSPAARQEIALARGGGVLLGTGFGILVSAALLALYFGVLKPSPLLAGTPLAVREKIEQLGLATVPGYLALAVFYSLAHSLLEEYYWRWFVFGRLRCFMRAPAAIVVSSLVFMAHHVIVVGVYLPGAWALAALVSLAVAMGGAVWAWLYETTGSLYGPWVSHLIVDAAIMTIGYDMIWGLAWP